MIICGKYGNNRSRTENVTERTRFSKSRSNYLEDIKKKKKKVWAWRKFPHWCFPPPTVANILISSKIKQQKNFASWSESSQMRRTLCTRVAAVHSETLTKCIDNEEDKALFPKLRNQIGTLTRSRLWQTRLRKHRQAASHVHWNGGHPDRAPPTPGIPNGSAFTPPSQPIPAPQQGPQTT